MADDTLSGVTLGEIGRRLIDLAAEVRALRAEHVRRDLYEAHRQSTEAAIAALAQQHSTDVEGLKKEIATREADSAALRRQLLLAGVGAVFALIVAIVTRIF